MSAYTYAMIKSAAVARGSAFPILTRITRAGFQVAAIQLNTICDTTLRAFYHEHVGKPYFPDLADSVTSSPVVQILLTHPTYSPEEITAEFRKLLGATNSKNAAVGTLREEFGGHRFNPNAPMADNAVHGSDGPTAAKFEASLFFPDYRL